jgi:hypothetical protein
LCSALGNASSGHSGCPASICSLELSAGCSLGLGFESLLKVQHRAVTVPALLKALTTYYSIPFEGQRGETQHELKKREHGGKVQNSSSWRGGNCREH